VIIAEIYIVLQENTQLTCDFTAQLVYHFTGSQTANVNVMIGHVICDDHVSTRCSAKKTKPHDTQLHRETDN